MNNKMFELFKKTGQEVLIMNHYELAERFKTHKYSVDAWREFLLDPHVQEYIRAEFAIIQESNMRKVISAVDDEDKSVGRAQLINAMLNAKDKTGSKRDGNTTIYAYILPNEEQAKAVNTEVIKRDPFKEE